MEQSNMMSDQNSKFTSIVNITQDLLQIQDIDILLERMLTEVRSMIVADAGSIYIAEGQKLVFSYTQNDTLQKKIPFGKKLIYSTFSIPINNKSIAGYVASTGLSVNIHDAYHLDQNQPYSFDKKFDEATGYRTQSMLTIPIKSRAQKPIGVIQLINAINHDKTVRGFTAAEAPVVELFAKGAAIAIDHAQMTRNTLSRMVKMIELHDPSETVQHANCIAAYSVEIYESWAHKKGIPEREIRHQCDLLRMAAMLCNVGKIAIPNKILQNQDNLSPEETKILQQHVIYGAKLFSNANSEFEDMVHTIALNHHERWDGNGYPGHIRIEDGSPLPGYEKVDGSAFGKRGNEIPLFARVVAVANAYDSLMGKCIDNVAIDEAKAVNMILADSGKAFDPEIVMAFLNCLEQIRSITTRYVA